MNHQLTFLRHYIIQHFNSSELRNICFDLAVDYDDLGGEGKSDKVRELISLMHRQQRLEDLIALVENNRQESLNLDLQGVYDQDDAIHLPGKPQPYLFGTRRKTLLFGIGFTFLLLVIGIMVVLRTNRSNRSTQSDNNSIVVTIGESSGCPVQVGDLISGRDRLLPEDHMLVTVSTVNPDNRLITYNWRASCGIMEPSLQTNVFQSNYYAPPYVILDEITLIIQTENCEPIERTIPVWVAGSDATNLTNCIPGVQPTAVPTIISPAAVDVIIFRDYMIQENDTLYLIAEQMNSSVELMQIHGIDENVLVVGTLIRLPIANPEYCPGMRSYIVKDQDTVFRIAQFFNTTVDILATINGFDENYTLYATTVICVP